MALLKIVPLWSQIFSMNPSRFWTQENYSTTQISNLIHPLFLIPVQFLWDNESRDRSSPYKTPKSYQFEIGIISMKHIVITGSTRGIGLGLAKAFLDLGCSVTISGRDKSDVNKVVEILGAEYSPERILESPAMCAM